MGMFLRFCFFNQTASPPVADWLLDRSGEPLVTLRFAAPVRGHMSLPCGKRVIKAAAGARAHRPAASEKRARLAADEQCQLHLETGHR